MSATDARPLGGAARNRTAGILARATEVLSGPGCPASLTVSRSACTRDSAGRYRACALPGTARTVVATEDKYDPASMTATQSICHDWFSTRRLFVTEKTPETLFACSPAMFLSIWLSTTPSSVTFPFLTMMWIDGSACNAYRFSAACP